MREGAMSMQLPEMSDREAHEMWQGLMETFALPAGVRYLSYESEAVLTRAAAADRAAWLRSLVERGVLDAPHPEEVRAVGQKLRALYEANKRYEGATTDSMAKAWQLYQERALVEQVGG